MSTIEERATDPEMQEMRHPVAYDEDFESCSIPSWDVMKDVFSNHVGANDDIPLSHIEFIACDRAGLCTDEWCERNKDHVVTWYLEEKGEH